MRSEIFDAFVHLIISHYNCEFHISHFTSDIFHFLNPTLRFHIAYLFRLLLIHREKIFFAQCRRNKKPRNRASFVCDRLKTTIYWVHSLLRKPSPHIFFACCSIRSHRTQTILLLQKKTAACVACLLVSFENKPIVLQNWYVNSLALNFFFFKFTLTLFRRSATFARKTALTRAVASTLVATRRRNTVLRNTTSTVATKAGQASMYLKVVVLSPFVSFIAKKSRGKFYHRELIVTEWKVFFSVF